MIYIKFSNGSTTRLINMHDEVSQNDAIECGFFMVKDADGSPAIVDSEDLISTKSKSQADIINQIKEKIGNKSDSNKQKIDHKKEKVEDSVNTVKGLI